MKKIKKRNRPILAILAVIVMLVAAGCPPDDNGGRNVGEGETSPQVYNITIEPSANGSISANPESAVAGTIIRLTISPETEYALRQGTLSARRASGESVSINVVRDTDNVVRYTGTFTMPASDVTVSGEFGFISGSAIVNYVPGDIPDDIELTYDKGVLYLNTTDSIKVTAPTGYVSYRWFIDGQPIADAEGDIVTENIVTMRVDDYHLNFVGIHTITVVVQDSAGIFHSGNLSFEVLWGGART